MTNRKIIILSSALCLGLAVYADVIVLKNGSSMDVFNVEVGKTSVFYTEVADSEADTKKLPISEVFAVKIGDGNLEMIGQSTPGTPQSSGKPTVKNSKAKAAGDNQELILQYSAADYQFEKTVKEKEAKGMMVIYRLSPQSVISTPEISVSFEMGYTRDDKWNPITVKSPKKGHINTARHAELMIKVHNKTSHPLYLDLAQSIRSGNMVSYRVYYDGSKAIESGSSSIGVGTSIFGIGIGSSQGQSNTIVKSTPNVIIIPANETVVLPPVGELWDYDKKIYYNYDYLSKDEVPSFVATDLKDLKCFEKRTFAEGELNGAIKFMLTYSSNQDLSDPKMTEFLFYPYQIIGMPSLFNAWSGKYEDDVLKFLNLDDKIIIGAFKLK